MKHSFTKIAILFVFLGLFSCSETVTDNNGRIKAMIQDIVLDVDTKLPLENVTVSWYQNGKIKTTKTDKNGFFNINDLDLGTYTITYTFENYAAIERKVNVNPELTNNYSNLEQLGNKDYKYTYTYKTYLEKEDQTFSAKLLIDMGNGFKVPASNADVLLTFSYYHNDDDNIVRLKNYKYESKANSEGLVEFGNIPSGSVYLSATYAYKGQTYSFSSNTRVYREENKLKTINGTFVNEVSNVFIKSINILDDFGNSLTNFSATSNIVIEFSDTVEVSQISSAIELFNAYEGNYNGTVSWTNGYTKLTFNPDSTLNNGLYEFKLPYFKTKHGYFSSRVFQFYVGGTNSVNEAWIKNYSVFNTDVNNYYANIRFTTGTNVYRYYFYVNHSTNPNSNTYEQIDYRRVYDYNSEYTQGFYLSYRGGSNTEYPFQNGGYFRLKVEGRDSNGNSISEQLFIISANN